METWRELISSKLEKNGEAWTDVIAMTLSTSDLDIEFNAFYSPIEGTPFYLWTENHVYFSAQWDGEEWCSSVPRHPGLNAKLKHVGGDSMDNDIEGPFPECLHRPG
jgi:hypothetical protein